MNQIFIVLGREIDASVGDTAASSRSEPRHKDTSTKDIHACTRTFSPRTTGHTLHRGLPMHTYTVPHTLLHKPARFNFYLEFVSVRVRPVPSADEANVRFFVYKDDVCVSISLDDFAAVSLLTR